MVGGAEKVDISKTHNQKLYSLFVYIEQYRWPSLPAPLDSFTTCVQLKEEKWAPDFGPATFVPTWGGTVTGVKSDTFSCIFDIADKCLGEKVPDRLQHQHAGHQGAGSQVSTGVYQRRLILQTNSTILRRTCKTNINKKKSIISPRKRPLILGGSLLCTSIST